MQLKPQIPEGWRELQPNEILLDGDVGCWRKWESTRVTGQAVGSCPGNFYIRQIASEVPAFTKDADGYPIIPEGWRQLHAHETLKEGDRFKCGEEDPEWKTTGQFGYNKVWQGAPVVYIRRRKS